MTDLDNLDAKITAYCHEAVRMGFAVERPPYHSMSGCPLAAVAKVMGHRSWVESAVVNLDFSRAEAWDFVRGFQAFRRLDSPTPMQVLGQSFRRRVVAGEFAGSKET